MKLLLGLALLLVALGSALFLWSDADHGIALERETVATREPQAARGELAALPQTGERESAETKRVFGESGSRLTDSEIEALPSELVLAGTVLIEESDGSETHDLNGRVHITAWLGERGNSYVAQVIGGRWKLRFKLAEDGTGVGLD